LKLGGDVLFSAYKSVIRALAYLIMFTACGFILVVGRKGAVPRAVARICARIINGLMRVFLGARLQVIGLDHIPQGPCIIASNHQSAWDCVIFFLLLSDPAYVAKIELNEAPLLGKTMGLLDQIFIDRKGGPADIKRFLKDVRHALTEGRQVVFFPEGTRNATGRDMDLKGGIDLLARGQLVPIVPVTHNSGLVWHGTSHPRTLSLTFHPAITTGEGGSAVSERLRQLYFS
jgi:1-acyl-sn-glycerol-3-phosphate acyltransferase